MNCSLPSMETALVEKLHKTYMLAAMWKKEKWLKVERSIGEQRFSAGRNNSPDSFNMLLVSFPTTHQFDLTLWADRLTGGRVGGEVLDHGSLQRRYSPTAEHYRISSNDTWENKTGYIWINKQDSGFSAVKQTNRKHHPLTCDRLLTLTQPIPPLVDLKHKQSGIK